MTGGESQGITVGDKFGLFEKGKMLKNPQTGINIELPGKQIAIVTIRQTLGSGNNELSLVDVSAPIQDKSLETLVVKEIE